MPRDVDDRKKRRALRTLRRAADLAEQGLGPPLSDWEQSFLEELEERIETYGSAFADPMKGDLSEPLSALQQKKLKEIDKKARGKEKPPKRRGQSGLGRKGPQGKTAKAKKAQDKKPTSRKTPVKRAIRQPLAKPSTRDSKAPDPPARTGFTPRLVPNIEPLPDQAPATGPAEEPDPAPSPQSQPRQTPAFRVIDGGKSD